MSYGFKKLSEVAAMNEVPEGAKVLAEVNGEIRRVPGSGLGGVQPDWSQNDETQPDYVKNRTHYREVIKVNIANAIELPYIYEKDTGEFAYNANDILLGIVNVDKEYFNRIRLGEIPIKVEFNGQTADLYLSENYLGDISSYREGTFPFIIEIQMDDTAILYTRTKAESTTANAYLSFENFVKIDSRFFPENVPLIGDDGTIDSNVVPKNETAVFMFEYDRDGTKDIKPIGGFAYSDIEQAYSQGKIVIARVCRKGNLQDCFDIIGVQAAGGVAEFIGYTMSLNLRGIVLLRMYIDGRIRMSNKELFLKSSESEKIFSINVDDSGTLTATEVTT